MLVSPSSRWLLVYTLVALSLTPASAQSTMSLDAGLWEMTPGGTLSLGNSGLAGTELDLEDDLGFDDEERVWQGAAYLGRTHQLAVSYLSFEATARSRLSQDMNFGPLSYAAETTLDSTVDTTLFGLGYRYNGGGDNWRSGFIGQLLWLDLEATAFAPGLGRAEGDMSTLFPIIGVFAEWQPAMILALGGTLQGGAWDWQETSVTYVDAQADVRLLLYPFVAGLGYRHLSVQGDDTSWPLEVDLTFAGPVFFAGLSF